MLFQFFRIVFVFRVRHFCSNAKIMADKSTVFQTIAIEYCAPAVDELQRQLQAAREEIKKLKRELKRTRDQLDDAIWGDLFDDPTPARLGREDIEDASTDFE